MDNDSQSTEQLIARARAGDAKALAELRKRLEPNLWRASEAGPQAGSALHDALDKTWCRLAEFPGSNAPELTAWLRAAVLPLLQQESAAPQGSLDTIAPAPSHDQVTLGGASSSDTVPPKPKTSDAANATAATSESTQNAELPSSAPDPSAVTTNDRAQGTVVSRPKASDTATHGAATSDSNKGAPPATDAGNVSDNAPASSKSEAPEVDPLATIIPTGDATVAEDPLATFVDPGGAGAPARSTGQPTAKTFGDYEILETIAKGGMGVVYKARHRKLNRVVALKMILAGESAHPDDIERFYVEAKAAAQLDHKNIVGIHELGEVAGQHYISMQFVEGQSLADLVREYPLDPRVASKYMAAISEAMQYAHGHGILHRDLKPGNILVDRDNLPLITDFGLAKLNPNTASGDEQARANQSTMTIAGQPMGTPSFMPPEQARGSTDQISELSDVYSLGATLYHLLTGKPPFAAVDVFKTMEQVLKVEPISPRVLNASVPKDLETICLKCLQKSPERRYGSAQDLADELRRYLAGEPIHARPVGLIERSIRWCRRNPWPTTAICASLIGLIVATSLWRMAVSARNDADAANATAQAERTEAVLARDLAKASRNQLFEAINELFNTWGSVKLLNEPALIDVRKELLTAATKLYTDIGKNLGDDPELRQELGGSYYRLALMMFHMEGYREAGAAVASARDNQDIDQLELVTDIARLRDWGETLTLSGNIKVKLSQPTSNPDLDPNGRLKLLREAEAFYHEAVAVRQRLCELVPDEIEYKRQIESVKMNLGTVLRWKGDAYYQRNVLLGDDPAGPDFKMMEEHFQEAKVIFEEVDRERRRLLESAPEAVSIQHDLAKGGYNLANISRLLAQYPAAEKDAERTIREFIGLLEDKPEDLQNRFELARAEQQAGEIAAEWLYLADSDEQRQALYRKALEHYNNAQGIYYALDLDSTSIVTRYKVALGNLHTSIGWLHIDVSDFKAARHSYETAISILKPLGEAHPASSQIANALAEAEQSLAGLPPPEAPSSEPPTPSPDAPP